MEKAPAKDEFKVAKWMKKNIPTKKTKFLNHNVEYFTGKYRRHSHLHITYIERVPIVLFSHHTASKTLDALLTTSFAQGENALFTTRDEAIQFLDSMLVHKFFHRAKKVPVSEAELRRGKKVKEQPAAQQEHQHGADGSCCGGGGGGGGDEVAPAAAANAELRKRATAGSSSPNADKTATEGSEADVNKSPKTPTATDAAVVEKKKRKIRLDMHPDQQFVDGAEAYIWIYDPIPVHYWLIGTLLVIGAIVVCLFPLWPPTLRLGVYYLSVAAAGFLVFILGLAFVRFVVFCIVWVLTGSKHHFWLFPNLTEDVGFFASFWPLYQHDYVDSGASKKVSKGNKVRKSKKDKLSDAEDDSTTATPTSGATAVAEAEAKSGDVQRVPNASGVDTEQDEDENEENR